MPDADRAAVLFGILPPDLMREIIKKVRNRRDVDEVEKELEETLQALEELDPKRSGGRKLNAVIEEKEKAAAIGGLGSVLGRLVWHVPHGSQATDR